MKCATRLSSHISKYHTILTSETAMSMLSPFLKLDCTCDETSQWLSRILAQNGLRLMQTFDLHNARHEMDDCPCPYHGTSKCDCQMIVLLVYSEAAKPTTLILHGNDGQTWLSFVDDPLPGADSKVRSRIKQVLKTI